MKYLFILFASNLFTGMALYSQDSIEKVIFEIQQNNTTLSALRKSADAELIGNKTGLYLKNPEVAFNYLWGSPAEIGNRTDISIFQSFDFPYTYVYRNQISDYKNIQTELEYLKQSKIILTKARLVCNDLIYYNALKSELLKRISHTQRMADALKIKYQTGELGILDYNKAQVNLLNLKKEAESVDIERNVLLSELKSFNGGKAIDFSDTAFPLQSIQTNFEQWYVQAEKNNPVLQWLEQEILISQKSEKLNAALSLPKVEAGYMSEKIIGQQYHGLTFSISIPILENKNTVRYAKAKTLAVQGMKNDAKLQFYNELKTLHSKAISLQKSINEFRSNLNMYDNAPLLLKAFEEGEISLTEYLYGLSTYYESLYMLLELEKELNKTVVELTKYQ